MELYDTFEIGTMPGTLNSGYLENLDVMKSLVLFLGCVCVHMQTHTHMCIYNEGIRIFRVEVAFNLKRLSGYLFHPHILTLHYTHKLISHEFLCFCIKTN